MKRLMTCLAVALLAMSFMLDAQSAYAQQDPSLGPVYAVQARKYRLKNEFSIAGGVLPLDAFAKGISFGGGYTYHFGDFTGIEVINFHIVENFSTGLRSDLEQNFGVSTTEFNTVNFLLNSSVVIKPIYGKMIFFNRALWHGELSFVVGGGVAGFEDGTLPAAHAGLIFRVWLSKAWSIRIDARDYVALDLDNSDLENILHIAAGLSFSFPWE